MKKIMIIGSGGAGKSTLARELGSILGLEMIPLDTRPLAKVILSVLFFASLRLCVK